MSGVVPKPVPMRISLSVGSELRQVVGHAIGQPRVGDVDVQAVAREPEPVEAAAVAADLLEAARGADPQRAVVLRAERVPRTNVVPAGPDLVPPAQLGVHVGGAGQHEQAAGQRRGVGEARRRVADLLEGAVELRSSRWT